MNFGQPGNKLKLHFSGVLRPPLSYKVETYSARAPQKQFSSWLARVGVQLCKGGEGGRRSTPGKSNLSLLPGGCILELGLWGRARYTYESAYTMRSAWLDAKEGSLSGKDQAKACALREIWRDAGKADHGMKTYIGGKLKKQGGGAPCLLVAYSLLCSCNVPALLVSCCPFNSSRTYLQHLLEDDRYATPA